MQQETRMRGDGASRGDATLPVPSPAERQPSAVLPGAPGAGGSVAEVPSEQLWRAAVLAARAAALTAAELRRSLEASRGRL